jgi:hypothetical protein
MRSWKEEEGKGRLNQRGEKYNVGHGNLSSCVTRGVNERRQSPTSSTDKDRALSPCDAQRSLFLGLRDRWRHKEGTGQGAEDDRALLQQRPLAAEVARAHYGLLMKKCSLSSFQADSRSGAGVRAGGWSAAAALPTGVSI